MCMYIRLPVVLLCSAPSMLKILLVSLDEGDRMETKHFVHRCRTTTTQPSEQENLIDSNTTHKHSHIVVMNVKNKKWMNDKSERTLHSVTKRQLRPLRHHTYTPSHHRKIKRRIRGSRRTRDRNENTTVRCTEMKGEN